MQAFDLIIMGGGAGPVSIEFAQMYSRFEPTAGREGTLAAGNALNGSKNSIDYDTVP